MMNHCRAPLAQEVAHPIRSATSLRLFLSLYLCLFPSILPVSRFFSPRYFQITRFNRNNTVYLQYPAAVM